jgi:O-antigen/teichoic acid export membrane protein
VGQALVIGLALLGIAHVISEISRGMGRPGFPALVSGIGSAAAVAVLPLVVPQFGVDGAALALTGVYALVLGILYVGLHRRLREHL